MSESSVRGTLTRLQMVAVFAGIVAAGAFIAAAVAYYFGFSDAEETLALPHPPGVFEILMVAVAVISLVAIIIAVYRYRKLANAFGDNARAEDY